MKRGMIDKSLSFGVLAGVLTFSFGLKAFADSKARMQAGAEASSQHAGQTSRQDAPAGNSASTIGRHHSEASAEAGRPTNINQIPVGTANERVKTVQPGVRKANNSRSASHRRHSGNSSRSYMINTIQQAARSK